MSNLNGMKHDEPRSEVARTRAHAAWHGARFRKLTKKTNEDGSITRIVSISPGPSFKEWARLQVKNSSPFATECGVWLENKSGAPERASKALRLKNKGGTLAMIAAATKASKKSKKK